MILWSLLALALWLGLALFIGLLRFDAYGLDEAAARTVLLSWSVVDRIVNPAVVLGVPDFRALLFAPLGVYWPGSLTAVKVFSLLTAFAAGLLLYQWNRRQASAESALIATGLLMISPALLLQIDTLGVAPYLLLAFGIGVWLDSAHRAARRHFGAWFFLQILLVMFAVSLHPAGLAYPMALLWAWYHNPLDDRHQKHIYIGVVCAVIFALLLRMGWGPQIWFGNPLTTLARLALGLGPDSGITLRWTLGTLLAATLLLFLIVERDKLRNDLTTRMLFLGVVAGLPAADGSWGLLALTVLLYLGIPRLIVWNETLDKQGFMGQRGLVMTAVVVLALLFMQADKAHWYANAHNLLSPQDQVILTLATELEDSHDDTLVMSQWPGRTMLATRRPVLPLTHGYQDGPTLLKKIRGVTHIVFDPFDPRNKALGENLSSLGGVTETLSLQEGGVIIHLRPEGDSSPARPHHSPSAAPLSK